MSKYIIELDDRIKIVTSVGVTENGVVYTTSDYVHNLEELNSDYINEHFGDLQDTAYQKGLDDAWECGKKLAWTAKYGGYGERLNDVFGRDDTFDFYDYTPNEAIEKLKAFEQKQDKIEVGDEVTASGELKCIVTVADYGNDVFYVLFSDGSCGKKSVDTIEKTGRHFDIASILEDMRHD